MSIFTNASFFKKWGQKFLSFWHLTFSDFYTQIYLPVFLKSQILKLTCLQNFVYVSSPLAQTSFSTVKWFFSQFYSIYIRPSYRVSLHNLSFPKEMNNRKWVKVTFEILCKKPSGIKVMNLNFYLWGPGFPSVRNWRVSLVAGC